jgi:transposase
MDRRQTPLFCPTLDAAIPEDHPARLFDELLRSLDWALWEARYAVLLGQPAIHPRILAAVILYALSQGFRSSRRIEWATRNALDFIWLAEGHTLDHSTICGFRTKFAKELKDLFRQLGELAMAMGLVRLNQVALDGTRIRANSSRNATATAETLGRRLSALDAEIERMFAEASQEDVKENDLFGENVSPSHLPKDLAEAKRRRAKLLQALENARQKDAERMGQGKAARVPVADPDSKVLPNKDGGFAPNYTPLAVVDGRSGLIVETEVLNHTAEGSVTVPMADRVTETLGEKPQKMLADANHGTGPNLAALQARGIEAYIPMEGRLDTKENPAHREDPTTPVSESEWSKLPRNAQSKKLDRAAFLYDREKDVFHCPMGRVLAFEHLWVGEKKRGEREYRQYRCESCEGCPLARECLGKGAKRRTVSRDEYEPLREAMDARLKSEEGKAVYDLRKWIAETPFGHLKGFLRLRQFLLRGLEKVRTEWRWDCTAYNVWKMAKLIGAMRVRLAVCGA